MPASPAAQPAWRNMTAAVSAVGYMPLLGGCGCVNVMHRITVAALKDKREFLPQDPELLLLQRESNE